MWVVFSLPAVVGRFREVFGFVFFLFCSNGTSLVTSTGRRNIEEEKKRKNGTEMKKFTVFFK